MQRRSPAPISRQLFVCFIILFCVASNSAASETVLHQFIPWANGTGPTGLASDAQGNFYGATYQGGLYGNGTVFKLSPGSNGQWTETVLYNFGGYAGDGVAPFAPVILDAAGNIYGTTTFGGGSGDGFGTVFEVSPAANGTWTEKILYAFQGLPNDGLYPYVGLAMDAAGNLYGITQEGGSGNCNQYGVDNCGTVYELSPESDGTWTEKVIYNFQSTSAVPLAGVVLDAEGNVYGVTDEPYGAVFELSPSSGAWTYNILHTFGTGNDGRFPTGVILDPAGNIYGMTEGGGATDDGTVFELQRGASGWHENILYNFAAGGPGYSPSGSLVRDSQSNFFGAVEFSFGQPPQLQSNGTVFELTPAAGNSWTATTVYLFQGGADGNGAGGLTLGSDGTLYGLSNGGIAEVGAAFSLTPGAGGRWVENQIYVFPSTDGAYPVGLSAGPAGTFYGATDAGGSGSGAAFGCNFGPGCGTIFQMSRTAAGSWQETVLYSFTTENNDGIMPNGNLLVDSANNIYGTTPAGGIASSGTVFKLSPPSSPGQSWQESTLHEFGPLSSGGVPYGGLVADSAGNLYGTTYYGGTGGGGEFGCGTVFELQPKAGGHWAESVIYDFKGNAGGCAPTAGLAIDSAGNLYGEASPIVFKLSRDPAGGWVQTILHTFTGDGDGWNPVGPLTLDAAGNLYGITEYGGAYDYGTVYEISPGAHDGWNETVLYSFGASLIGGLNPTGDLVFDRAGNLYGTTEYGGSDISPPCFFGNYSDCGTVFRLSPTSSGAWTESTLYNFTGAPLDGSSPRAGVALDAEGNVFGVTSGGGSDYQGVIFEIAP